MAYILWILSSGHMILNKINEGYMTIIIVLCNLNVMIRQPLLLPWLPSDHCRKYLLSRKGKTSVINLQKFVLNLVKLRRCLESVLLKQMDYHCPS